MPEQAAFNLFVLPDPPGASATYNDHPTGVDYDAGSGRWQIVNLDGAAMPTTVAFNVLPVPEPDATLALVAGMALLALLDRLRPKV